MVSNKNKDKEQKQSMLNGALILVVATMLVKVIGALYKMPLTALIGEVGRGYFNSAYEIHTPIYAISMAGLPIAVSKLVSQYIALNRYRDARLVKKVAGRIFFITGILGTLILLIVAYPYSAFLTKSPDNVYSILMIAPTIFFCCMMSTYRGYYEGTSNMTPTAVSQVVEALGKLVLGLLLSYLTLQRGLAQFEAGTTVFGREVANKAEALSAIYPFTAAAAILGVTIGTVFGYIYLALRYKIKGEGFTRIQLVNSPKPDSVRNITKTLIKLAIPMVFSALILNITNLIDTITIQNRLAHAVETDLSIIRNMYSSSLTAAGILDTDVAKYLFGVYGSALDFKNLIPTITMTLGVSAIPVLSAAYALKDKKRSRITIESVIRVTMLIALPSGIGMGVLAKPILTMIYGGTDAQNLIPIAAPIMALYSYATALFSISTPLSNMLQAIGRADVPVKSLALGATVKIIFNYILVGNPNHNINGAVIGTILCHVIIVLYNLFFLLRISKTKINFTSVLFKPLLSSVLCGVVAHMSFTFLSRILPQADYSSHLNGTTFAAIISIGLAVVVYSIALLFTRSLSKDDINMLPKGEKIAKILEKYNLLG